MNKWDALAKIVLSFNSRGSPGYALLTIFLFLAAPIVLIGLAIWLDAPTTAARVLNAHVTPQH